MAVLYTNNAVSALSASITSTATSFSVTAGHGVKFPALSGVDYFYVTLYNNAGNIEIVKVTARATDTFTVVRAQDGTSGLAFTAADKVELRVTKAVLDDIKTDTKSSLTSGNVTTALGFTPYNATNPTGYITSAGSVSQLNGKTSSAFSGPDSAVKQYFWTTLGASATQARTFEIARLGIDYNDWNVVGPFEVELYERYYSQGLKKKYVISYGTNQNSTIQLVEYSGTGVNNFRVRIGTPVLVTGDNYYLPVFVDVREYSQVDVRGTTNRPSTASTLPGIGLTYINASPTATNISDFSADSTVNFASVSTVQVAGNQVLHAGNYNSYAPTLTGTGASGSWGISVTGNSATVGGFTPSASSGVGSRVVVADSNGYIFNNYFNSTDNAITSGVTAIMSKQGDNYYRSASAAAVATFISGQSMNIIGSASYSDYVASQTNPVGNFNVGLTRPKGASYTTTASSVTGAIKIKMPVGVPLHGMWKMTVKIYEYGQRGNGYTIELGCHLYPSAAYNRYQWMITTEFGAVLPIRYGTDGTSGCIWIGENATTWLYPQIHVTEFSNGYSNPGSVNWTTGTWAVSIGTIDNSVAVDGPYTTSLPVASAVTGGITTSNYNSYSPTLTGGSASGTWGINVTGSSGSCTGNAATITSQANSATITASTAATANQIVLRDGSGDDFRRYGFANYFNMSHGVSGATTDTVFYSSGDDYIRKNNATGFRASLNVPTRTGGDASGTWGISVTGSSASATGLTGSNYINSTGSSGNFNTDFQNTTAYTKRYNGDSSSITNNPGGAWWFVENMRHSNSSNYWGTQIAWGWEDNANRLATRNVQSGSFGGWVYYLNSNNYSSYALPLSGGTLTGNLTISGGGAVILKTGGDITAYRSGGTTGVIYLNSAENRYLYYDGTNYNLNVASLVVGGNVTAYSDERVKTNWRELQPDFIEQLAKVKHGIYDRTDQEMTQVGVSAQSLRPVLEHAVLENEDGTLAVAYGNAAMVSAVELAKRVVEQDARIARLETLVSKLIGD